MRIDSIRFLGVRSATIALLFVLIHAPLAAQGPLGWTQVSTVGPTPRSQPAMAYDSQCGRQVKSKA